LARACSRTSFRRSLDTHIRREHSLFLGRLQPKLQVKSDALIIEKNFRSETVAKASYRSKKFDKAVFKRGLAEVVERVAD
jgi:hypothetical protein